MSDSFTRSAGNPGLFDFRIVRTDGGKLSAEITLRELAEQVEDLRVWGMGVAIAFYEAERKQFATEGALGGLPWPELQPAYAAEKETEFPGRGILERTGALRRSLTTPPSGSGIKAGKTGRLRSASQGDAVIQVKPDTLEIGTEIDYAPPHQKPKKAARRRPPIPGAENFVLVMTQHGVQTLREVIEDTVRR